MEQFTMNVFKSKFPQHYILPSETKPRIPTKSLMILKYSIWSCSPWGIIDLRTMQRASIML